MKDEKRKIWFYILPKDFGTTVSQTVDNAIVKGLKICNLFFKMTDNLEHKIQGLWRNYERNIKTHQAFEYKLHLCQLFRMIFHHVSAKHTKTITKKVCQNFWLRRNTFDRAKHMHTHFLASVKNILDLWLHWISQRSNKYKNGNTFLTYHSKFSKFLCFCFLEPLTM